MTRSISLPVHESDEFLRSFGAIKRRMEIERVKIEHKIPEMGLAFEDSQIEFKQLPKNLFQGEIVWRLQKYATPEQITAVILLEEAAGRTEFELKLDNLDFAYPQNSSLNLLMEPSVDVMGLLETSFEERKALPPASKNFNPLSDFFKHNSESEPFYVRKK